MLYMSYRAKPENFLPPAKKHEIKRSDYSDTDGIPWLFGSINRSGQQWALFQSDQWNPSWKIVYTLKTESMPQAGETVVLKSDKNVLNCKVVKWYPSKRVCITYLLTINSILEL